jgi:hypothetical protein
MSVRTGDGSGPPTALEASDPAAQRAIEAARKLLEALKTGQKD